MKLASTTIPASLAVATPRKLQIAESSNNNPDKIELQSQERSSRTSQILKSAAVGAAYGAAVGTASGLLYSNVPTMNATAIHMGAILAGGAGGAVVIGNQMPASVDRPANYALGAVAGAGITWGTSALGLLQNPVVGGVGGALLGGFYGAVAGFIHSTATPNEAPQKALTQQTPSEENSTQSHKGAWNAMAGAYALGGTVLGGRVAYLAATGQISSAAALGGGAIAAVALGNAYLIHRLVA